MIVRQFKNWFGQAALIAAVSAAPLCGAVSELKQEGERPQFNTRPMSQVERAEWIDESVKEEDLVDNGDLEEDDSHEEESQLMSKSADARLINKGVFEVGFEGGLITLHDGSIWQVKPSDGRNMSYWPSIVDHGLSEMPVQVYITQNSDFFKFLFSSGYPFKLVNAQSGESVHVNLSLAPLYEHVAYITFIDYGRRVVELSDGTRWHVTAFDKNLLKSWAVYDYVMLGANTRWNKSTKPYLLVNISTYNMVRAQNF